MSALWRWIKARFHRRRVTAPPVAAPAPAPAPPPVVAPPPPPPPTTARIVPPRSAFTRVLASASFDDGTWGPFYAWGADPWKRPDAPVTMEIIDDPTGKLGGKVASILYSTDGTGLQSSDQNLETVLSHKFRYNEPVLMRGKFVIPSVPESGTHNYANTRKLFDWFHGGPPNTRLVLHRTNGKLGYALGQYEADGVWAVDRTQGETGITLLDDAAYDMSLLILPNSADGVRDGVMQIWVNNDSDTPDFTLTGLSPITEKDGGISAFYGPRFGTQLTSQPGDGPVSERRYWKDIEVRTTPATA